MAIILLILCLVGALAGTTHPAEVKPMKHDPTKALEISSSLPVTVTPEATCDPARSIYRDLSVPIADPAANPPVHICDDK